MSQSIFFRRLEARWRFSPVLLAGLISLLSLTASLEAQNIYGISNEGRLTVNGTLLDDLKSEFTINPIRRVDEAWSSLDVEGSDRWALQGRG